MKIVLELLKIVFVFIPIVIWEFIVLAWCTLVHRGDDYLIYEDLSNKYAKWREKHGIEDVKSRWET